MIARLLAVVILSGGAALAFQVAAPVLAVGVSVALVVLAGGGAVATVLWVHSEQRRRDWWTAYLASEQQQARLAAQRRGTLPPTGYGVVVPYRVEKG